MKLFSQKNLIIFIISLSILVVASTIVFQILNSQKNVKSISQQQVVQEAKAHFQGIVDTRSWNAQYGGVYVRDTKGLKPNPFLKDNIIYTDTNETLIKVNPAWMTRQISDISNQNGSYHFKITSLLPLNPSNQADKFETQALEFFDKNRDKKYFYSFDEQRDTFDFMGSLVTEQACLSCHAHQGYKLGDIRGGIRVSIPMALYNEKMVLLEGETRSYITVVVLIALGFIVLLYWLISLIYKRQYEIEHTNEILEKKVLQRTHDLEMLVSHEKHLKDVLTITTEVNEMLITSYSTKTILKNATRQLASNENYSLVMSGLIHSDILEIVSESIHIKSLVDSNIVELKPEANANFLFDAIEKSRRLKHPIIEKISSEFSDRQSSRREDDLVLNWMMVLPLLQGVENQVYGMITVFCSQEDGFVLEEMKILENMAHDISMSLYSQKQKASILEMEREKIANYEETILAFVNIIEQRDTYTAGHTIRVAEYCALIAREMDFSEEDINKLEKAAILHDIGKVATPDTILLKPGKLSHLEYELIKQHSEVGASMLEKITIYKNLSAIIRYHHARYDGKGYPETSSPDEIPMLSHIMIVADAFDAMTTNRIYRPRKDIQSALEELQNSSGKQFHPDVVVAALEALKDVNIGITTQMPTSELEARRMSYFFQDSLTGLYNEDYLFTILNSPNHKYLSLYIIDLKMFTLYNKEFGWEKGNIFLQEFAKYLTELFEESIVVRYHGDDFVVLNKLDRELQFDINTEFSLLAKSSIEVDITYHKIDKYFNFEAFKKLS